MIIKEKEEQVSSLLAERQARMGETTPATCVHDVDKNRDILLFNHKYSTLEPFYSSLPPVTFKSPNQPPPSPPMSLSHPEPSSSLHFKLGTSLPTKKGSGVSSTFTPLPLHNDASKHGRKAKISLLPRLSCPLLSSILTLSNLSS